jgi:hypothetical protein
MSPEIAGLQDGVASLFGAFTSQIAALVPFLGIENRSRRKLDVSYLLYGRT